jgi:hypothetical protein
MRTITNLQMRNIANLWLVGALLIAALPAQRVEAQAFCALRDPVSAIQEFFPGTTSYRSIIREVTESHRTVIGNSLPFNIHQSELGLHTLYAIFTADEVLAGFVHVRSERGKWGLSELAWSLDAKLNILGFRFQRSRETGQDYSESEAYQKQLRGLGTAELSKHIKEKAAGQTGQIKTPAQFESLSEMIIRSALKTIAVTKIVWNPTVDRLSKRYPARK